MFYGLPEFGIEWACFLHLFSGPFPSVCVFALSKFDVSFILFYFSIINSWKLVYFLLRGRKSVDPDGRGCGEDLGGVKGGEDHKSRIYYVRKICF